MADLWKLGHFALELDSAGKGEAYILWGDIPYPYPTKGYALDADTAIEEFVNASPSEERPYESEDPLFTFCWKQCPVCFRVDMAPLTGTFCSQCITKAGDVLEEWISGTLDAPEDFAMLPNFINLEAFLKMGGNVDNLRDFPDFERGFELLPKLLNHEFFRVGHRSRDLRKAYAAAKSARFEHGATGRSF